MIKHFNKKNFCFFSIFVLVCKGRNTCVRALLPSLLHLKPYRYSNINTYDIILTHCDTAYSTFTNLMRI